MNQHFNPSRRDILRGGGALVVSFSLASPMLEALAQAGPAPKPLVLTEVDAFLAIDSKGMCTVYSGKVDLGTGVATALRQMAAEELDLPLDRVDLLQGDTALTPDQGTTWGSLSIQVGGVQIRQASAAARAALLDQAAKRLGAPRESLTVADGAISDGSRRVSYAELVGGRSFSITLNPKQPVATKSPKDFKLVGKPVARIDIPGKVTGTFTYMHDFQVPGMLHGRVVRPSGIGATLESVDEGSINNIPTARVVRQGNFLAVVAENEWAAVRAAGQLKAGWTKWEGLPEQAKLFEHVRATRIVKDEVTGDVGDTTAAMGAQGSKKLSATYDFAIHTHGSMGPSCAVAEFTDGKLTSWSASQATHNLRKQLAKMFDTGVENVRCIYLEGAGC
jgi:nicotinate dehydrogenase subunit B